MNFGAAEEQVDRTPERVIGKFLSSRSGMVLVLFHEILEYGSNSAHETAAESSKWAFHAKLMRGVRSLWDAEGQSRGPNRQQLP